MGIQPAVRTLTPHTGAAGLDSRLQFLTGHGLNFRFQASPLAKPTISSICKTEPMVATLALLVSLLRKYFLKITGFINTIFHYCFTWTFKGKLEGETKKNLLSAGSLTKATMAQVGLSGNQEH